MYSQVIIISWSHRNVYAWW